MSLTKKMFIDEQLHNEIRSDNLIIFNFDHVQYKHMKDRNEK